MIHRFARTSVCYFVLSMLTGLVYFVITRMTQFTGETRLSVLPILLALMGGAFFLIVLLLEQVYHLSAYRMTARFYWCYHVGLLLTTVGMCGKGLYQVYATSVPTWVAPLTGIGHLLLSIGAVLFLIILWRDIPRAYSNK